jgi:hypothetical protein
MIDRNTAEFHRMTVTNFCLLDAATLEAIKADLGLCLTLDALCYIQQHYASRERHDPTVGELCFLDALARNLCSTPGSIRIKDVTGDRDSVRSFRDIQSKREQLRDPPSPTLPELMDTLPRYLARSGFPRANDNLLCATSAELAMRCNGIPPKLVLELTHTAAALLPAPKPSYLAKTVLAMLSPTGDAAFADEIAQLLSLPEAAYLSPMALPGAEGILPHLLKCSGIQLDTAKLAGFDPDKGPAMLTGIGEGSLLLCIAPEALPALLSHAPALTPLGTLTQTNRLQLHHGAQPLLSLELPFLRSLKKTRECALAVPTDAPCAIPAPALVQTADTLLIGLALEGNATQALASLAGIAYQNGADLCHSTLGIVLELPFGNTATVLARALSLLLGAHRSAAELLLPAGCQRILCTHSDVPRLSLFLTAPKTKARTADIPTDFDAARALYYGN